MTATQLAALAARIERAMREVTELAHVIHAIPADMLPASTRRLGDLYEVGYCVPRLSAAASTLRGIAAHTANK